MAEGSRGIHFNPDAIQAYQFEADYQDLVGYVHHFKVGDATVLNKDMSLNGPKRPNGKIQTGTYVGVIEELSWGGLPQSDMTVKLRVSPKNRKMLVEATHDTGAATKVEFGFTMWDYDTAQYAWFPTLFVPSETDKISGMIQTAGDGIALTIEEATAKELSGAGVRDYVVSVTITPGTTVQQIHYATMKGSSVVKTWGVPAQTGQGTGSGTSGGSGAAGGDGGNVSPAAGSRGESSPDPAATAAVKQAVNDLGRDVDNLTKDWKETEESLRADLGLTVRWLRALDAKVELVRKENERLYQAKPGGALNPAEKTQLENLKKMLDECRRELRHYPDVRS